MPQEKIYKIINLETELFSSGGSMGYSRGRWSKKGKKWNELHHVHRHIANNINYYKKLGDRVQIVEYVTVANCHYKMDEVLLELEAKQIAKETARKESYARSELSSMKREKTRLETKIKKMENENG